MTRLQKCDRGLKRIQDFSDLKPKDLFMTRLQKCDRGLKHLISTLWQCNCTNDPTTEM